MNYLYNDAGNIIEGVVIVLLFILMAAILSAILSFIPYLAIKIHKPISFSEIWIKLFLFIIIIAFLGSYIEILNKQLEFFILYNVGSISVFLTYTIVNILKNK